MMPLVSEESSQLMLFFYLFFLGVYFARHAAVADKYSNSSKNTLPLCGGDTQSTRFGDTRVVFLARVIIGKTILGQSHFQKPDHGSSENSHDSCVDNIKHPKIFIIFDSNQIYPEYLIQYKWHQEKTSRSTYLPQSVQVKFFPTYTFKDVFTVFFLLQLQKRICNHTQYVKSLQKQGQLFCDHLKSYVCIPLNFLRITPSVFTFYFTLVIVPFTKCITGWLLSNFLSIKITLMRYSWPHTTDLIFEFETDELNKSFSWPNQTRVYTCLFLFQLLIICFITGD